MGSDAGTAVTEYRGPKFLQELCERFELKLFDRVTKLRISNVKFDELDLGLFTELEEVKGDWPQFIFVEKSEQDKWNLVKDYPVTKKVKETFGKCQLKFSDASIEIDRNVSCSQK